MNHGQEWQRVNYCQKVSDTATCRISSQVHTLSCSYTHPLTHEVLQLRRGADKSLDLPGRKEITATKLGIYSTYSPRNSILFLVSCSKFCKAWISFGVLPCRKWQLASWFCWNRARRLTCFISASVTRKDLQFGTWTDPSFQRHYRFRPTTSGSRSS